MGKGVRIPIRLDKDKAEADAKEFTNELKSGMKDAAEFGVVATEAFEAFKATLEKVLEITKEVVKVSAENEAAEFRTFAALELHTKAAAANLVILQEQNEARRQWTAVSNAQQLQLEGTALQMGVEAGHLKTVLDATVNLSNVTGKDLSASLVSVVKLYEGNTKALQRMGIEVNSVQEGFDKLSALSSVTATRMETFSGHVDILKSNFEELMVALGNSIVRNDDVKKFLSEVNDYLKQLIDEVVLNGPAFKSRVSEIVGELRELGTWIKDHKDDIVELVHLFSLASKVKIASSLIGAAGNLAGGAGGKLLAAGAGAAGRSFMGAVGGGGALGAAALGGAALAGTAALAYSIPETNSAGVANAMMLAQGYDQVNAGGMVKGAPGGFKQTAMAGSGLEPAGYAPEFGSTFSDKDYKADAEARAKQEANAKKKLEIENKAWHEYIAVVDLELAAYHHRLDVEEQWQNEELAAKAKWAKSMDALDVAKIQAESVRATDLNRARINGFKSIDELHQAEIRNGKIYKNTTEEQHDEQAQAEKQFWEGQASTAAQGLASFTSAIVQGAAKGDAAGAVKSFLAGILNQMGQALVSLGTAVELAALFSLPAPWSWAATGGPAGIAAGLGMIVAGGALMGAGALVGGGTSASASSAGRSPSSPSSSAGGGWQSPGGIYSGGGASMGSGKSISVVNVSIDGSKGLMVGNSAQVARYLADLLAGSAGGSLAGG